MSVKSSSSLFSTFIYKHDTIYLKFYNEKDIEKI